MQYYDDKIKIREKISQSSRYDTGILIAHHVDDTERKNITGYSLVIINSHRFATANFLRHTTEI